MNPNPHRKLLVAVATIVFAFSFTACDPPGKPDKEDEHLGGPTDFKGLYAQSCSGCHGEDGRQGAGRVLNDPLYLAVSSRRNIRNILINGRPGTLMPAFAKENGGPLDDQQIDVIVDGIEKEWAKPFDSKGANLPPYDLAGLTGNAANGRKLFLKDCFACHAKGGIAGPVNDKDYLSLSSNQNLRTSIIVGRPDFPGVPMPDYRTLNAGHALQAQDIANLVEFLSSQRPPGSSIAMLEAKGAINPAQASNTEGMKQ